MHIYLWQIDPPIKHRCFNTTTPHLPHLITDLAQISAKPLHHISLTHRTMHIYPEGRWIPPKLTIAACKTITPHKFHL